MKTKHLILAFFLPALMACGNINQSITIGAGAKQMQDHSTVNGMITVGRDAAVGSLSTVNGAVVIGGNARTGSASTVNGTIKLGPKSVVTGDVSTTNGSVTFAEGATSEGNVGLVNGGLRLEPGARVEGDASTVNGDVKITSATVTGSFSITNGEVVLEDGASIGGDFTVDKPGDKSPKPMKITLGRNVRIGGKMKIERKNVRVLMHPTAKVEKGIEGAKPEPLE